MSIKSNISWVIWKINNKSKLNQQDINFIKQFNPCIYHNDLTSKLWTFDIKLPSGKWLENITFNNELTMAKALIL